MWDITGRGICKDEPSCRSEPHQLHLVVAGGVSDFTPSFLCPSLLWSCAGVRMWGGGWGWSSSLQGYTQTQTETIQTTPDNDLGKTPTNQSSPEVS